MQNSQGRMTALLRLTTFNLIPANPAKSNHILSPAVSGYNLIVKGRVVIHPKMDRGGLLNHFSGSQKEHFPLN